MSPQASILAICNIIIVLSTGISMLIFARKSEEIVTWNLVVNNVAAFLLFIVIMALQVYSLNCMVTGDCQIWAWVVAGFAVFGTLAYLGLFAYLMGLLNKIKNAVDSKYDDMELITIPGTPVEDAASESNEEVVEEPEPTDTVEEFYAHY